MRLLKTLTLGAAALGMALTATAASAFEPSKPIDFVIMAGKGGGR